MCRPSPDPDASRDKSPSEGKSNHRHHRHAAPVSASISACACDSSQRTTQHLNFLATCLSASAPSPASPHLRPSAACRISFSSSRCRFCFGYLSVPEICTLCRFCPFWFIPTHSSNQAANRPCPDTASHAIEATVTSVSRNSNLLCFHQDDGRFTDLFASSWRPAPTHKLHQ